MGIGLGCYQNFIKLDGIFQDLDKGKYFHRFWTANKISLLCVDFMMMKYM